MKRTAPSSRPTPPTPRSKPQVTRGRNIWLSHHVYVFFLSLGQFFSTPLANFMTSAVIAIALALPGGFYLLLENAQQITQTWAESSHISLFLNPQMAIQQAEILGQQLGQRQDIQSVRLVTSAEALEEYRKYSGFGEALNALEGNPLPNVLIIQPALAHLTPSLLQELDKLEEVDVAQFDMRWLQRLLTIIAVVQRGILILAGLLAITVLLVVGNTIRLAIFNRREEIEVTKLFGGTNAFIRRPFLYIGFWYGLVGGLIAWLLVNISFWLLRVPIQKLSTLYATEFEIITLDIQAGLILVVTGIALGLAGAWLAVGKHLRVIQPH